RIEGGLKDMIQAISACPTTIAEIVALAAKIEADEIKVDDVVDGFVDADEAAAAPVVSAADDDEDDEEEDEEEDESEGGGAAAGGYSAEQLAQLKAQALETFAIISTHYDKMCKPSCAYGSKSYVAAQEAISAQLLGIRFTAKVVEKLCDTLRGQME